MARKQKAGYLLNEWMVGWLLLYVMVMVAVVAMASGDVVKLSDYLVEALTILAVSAVMLGPFVVVKWLTICRSIRRTLATDATGAHVVGR